MDDITGSIANATAPLSLEVFGSLAANATGSSAIDTIVGFVAGLPTLLLGLVAGIGADLGSTTGNPLG
ncbi:MULTISPECIES: hypothetical protein [Dietzia]|uniref:hypothetical protein n=1 Tax=Dietzia TaxID=37914 RepID=UPI000D090C28|nr:MULTISPECIES: hypothetical protein [Dietzia]AVM64622.1 hypothetical protein C3V38_09720 [Dietzia sp. oral taxon 368]MCT1712887.1 hypothetical protein [Dietzia cinnamea]MCT2057650.1 hypothetical protein [Dietzia cinnamea]MCT2264159.1 hypothetical protein [Dietzia cinnamea]MCT2275844.1 hypothetical protein [Dietzia cinnamea]